MMDWLASQLFLAGAYWPYLLGAVCVGAITGWLSLGRAGASGD